MTKRCLIAACVVAASCAGGRGRIEDPIQDVPERQQRTADRYEDVRWPLTVGRGTLGCDGGAVMFRANATTYALNDAAKGRGFASIDSIRLTQSPAPTNPLKRIPQDRRMQIFRQSADCDRRPSAMPADRARCRQRVRDSNGLSDADLTQIDAEGVERFWPPLPPHHASLDALVEAGLKLCAPGR